MSTTPVFEAPYVVNARFLAHRITGVQRYAHEIASRLTGGPALLQPQNGKGARGHAWEQLVLPRLAAGRLLWSPSGAGPVGYTRQVVTIHDLFAIEHPEWYSGAFAKWYGFMLRRLAREARHLLAVSNYTKERVVRVLGRNPDDITVVPNAVSSGLRLTSTVDAARASTALALPSRRYVLSVSSLEARKNLPTVLRAWREAQRSLPDNVWLVLAGAAAPAAVYGKQELSGIPARVHFTGYVPEEHLAGLYSGASLFLFPSLAEGFGLPLLEAMNCGLRAITANTSSLPEVGGNAAVYVDPLDVRELAAAIVRELPAQNAAADPFLPALEQAARFSWDSSARKTEDVLLHAAAVHEAGAREGSRHWSAA